MTMRSALAAAGTVMVIACRTPAEGGDGGLANYPNDTALRDTQSDTESGLPEPRECMDGGMSGAPVPEGCFGVAGRIVCGGACCTAPEVCVRWFDTHARVFVEQPSQCTRSVLACRGYDPPGIVRCDGPEDCPAGAVCCFDGRFSTECRAVCPSSAVVCSIDADCPLPSRRCVQAPYENGLCGAYGMPGGCAPRYYGLCRE